MKQAIRPDARLTYKASRDVGLQQTLVWFNTDYRLLRFLCYVAWDQSNWFARASKS